MWEQNVRFIFLHWFVNRCSSFFSLKVKYYLNLTYACDFLSTFFGPFLLVNFIFYSLLERRGSRIQVKSRRGRMFMPVVVFVKPPAPPFVLFCTSSPAY